MPSPHVPTGPRGADPRRGFTALTLDDLTQDLVWPRLLRAGPLALRPARLGLAAVYLLLALAAVLLARAIAGSEGAERAGVVLASAGLTLGSLVEALVALKPGAAARELHTLAVVAPGQLLRAAPLGSIVGAGVLLFLTVVFGGAISRTAATESAQGVSLAWPKALGFALSRWTSLVGAVLIPLAIIWGVALGLHVAGAALFTWGVGSVVGGLLWPVLMLAGMVGAVVLLAFALGHPLLVSSVACEGTDAIDAVQHAYSIVFARPVRLAGYLLLLVVQGVAMAMLVWVVVLLTMQFVQDGVGGSGGEGGRRIVGALQPAVLSPDYAVTAGGVGEPRGLERAGGGLARLFTGVLLLVGASYAVSYVFTASTLLYLAMRRVVDGQDMSEIYMPTMLEGTMAPRRSVETPRAARQDGSVSDTGPADET